MQLLFHAFPRVRHDRPVAGQRVAWLPHQEAELRHGFGVLEQILEHGILCTPERFGIYADPQSERAEKLASLRADAPYAAVTQSRACFTLMERHELVVATGSSPSHAQVFGPFAIGLDPVRCRTLGICPVSYTYRHVHGGARPGEVAGGTVAGLGSQIVSRLMEIATVFSVLSRIEARARPDERWALPTELLDEIDVGPKFEPLVEQRLRRLDQRSAAHLLEYFDTDRVAAWNIVDFVHLLLSLYQSADSTIDGTPLAFFNQREWRLVFHTRRGLEWIGVGTHPEYRDPAARRMHDRRQALRRFLASGAARRRADDAYLQGCWALHSVDGLHFRDFISEIVVPAGYVAAARELVRRHRFVSDPPVVHAGASTAAECAPAS